MVAVEQGDGELPPGTPVLRRYSVVGKLAQGGMAEVYLARQQGPAGYNKLVVVKRVRPHLANDSDFVGMFVNEARLAAMINHPNVVQIFDLGDQPRPANLGGGTDWFLAMEYLDGRDMLQVGRACRSNNKAVPFDVTARIIADACAGLDHAHGLKGPEGKSLELVHRDMSPENVLITFEGQVKVVDFGIAKASDNLIKTQAGQIKGKLGYVAPEAILGKPVDARADVFAIGATLYLFLSGRPAFTGTTPMDIFERSLKPPVPPREVNNRVPEQLDAICMKALAQDRDKRYRSAGEVRIALEAYLQSTGRPLGPVQLGQFMRILFPPDKDPVRQRIDKLIADAGAAPSPPLANPMLASQTPSPASPAPHSQAAPPPMPPPRPTAPAPVVVEDDDNDKTNIVPPRPDVPDPVTLQAQRRPPPTSPPHLRSVGIAGGERSSMSDMTSEDLSLRTARNAGVPAVSDAPPTVELAKPAAEAGPPTIPVPRPVSPVSPKRSAPPTIELGDGDAVSDEIDLDAPTVEVQAVTRRGGLLASQVDVAASLLAGANARGDDLPPPPLEASGVVRRPPAASSPPLAFPPSSPSPPPSRQPPPSAPAAAAPPPAFSLAAPSPVASAPSRASPPAPQAPMVSAPVSADIPIDVAPPAPDFEAAPSIVWTGGAENAPLPPVAPLRPRTQSDAAASSPAQPLVSPASGSTAGLVASPPVAAPASGPGLGLKAAMFLFGALTGVVLVLLFLWASGLKV